MTATSSATTIEAMTNGRNSRHGDMPAAFITMISESVASLLRTCAIAITRATGAITSTSCGITSPVMPMNTSIDWPWLVIRSISRSAWVTQMSAVRLIRINRKAPSVCRNM